MILVRTRCYSREICEPPPDPTTTSAFVTSGTSPTPSDLQLWALGSCFKLLAGLSGTMGSDLGLYANHLLVPCCPIRLLPV